jgi:hypothetical protein
VRRRLRALAVALLACGASHPLDAQKAEATVPGSELTISIVTMGPGTMVWERFGHNAIRVTDARTGADTTYNYGMFDFASEGFIVRFAQGRMRYWTEGHPAHREIGAYLRANRSVWIQELNLTPRQKTELRDFLEWNSREENKFYPYDYYHDNCSTRVRDALDRVIGGAIEAQTSGTPSGTTFRSHTRRLTENDPVVYTGINIGLGPSADRPISAWEEMFLPLALRDHLRTITVPAAEGGVQPLVRSEATEFLSTAPEPPPAPPTWWPRYLAAGTLLGALLAGLGERLGRSGYARFGFRVIAGGWSLVAGLAGLVLAGLWLLTDHAVTYGNQNLFQLSPLSLPLALLAPRIAGRAPGPWTIRLSVAVAVLAAVGLLWKALPVTAQVNGETIALALPIHLGLAIAVWRAGQRGSGWPAPGPQSSPG